MQIWGVLSLHKLHEPIPYTRSLDIDRDINTDDRDRDRGVDIGIYIYRYISHWFCFSEETYYIAHLPYWSVSYLTSLQVMAPAS